MRGMSETGRGTYLGVDAALDDDEDEACHWCRRMLVNDGYGIEGFQFCDEDCANAWWWEWCRE
jgi:hypothetical protein